MSSNDEMYSNILTPCLSPTPTPFFSFFFFPFLLSSCFFSCFSKVLSAISSLHFFLFTDQTLTVRFIQARDDPLCRKGKRYMTYECEYMYLDTGS